MRMETELPDDFPKIRPQRQEKHIRTRRPRWFRYRLLLLAVIPLAVLLPVGTGIYTNWLWFQQLGYQTVFTTTLSAKAWLGAAVGLITAALIWLNFKLALRLSPVTAAVARRFMIEGQEIPAPDFSALAPKLAPLVALAIGVFAAMYGWGSWETYLRFRHQVPFGETDPIFGRDIAFYFFTLPALDAVSGLLMLIAIVSLIGSALIYLAHGAIDLGQIANRLHHQPRRALPFALPVRGAVSDPGVRGLSGETEPALRRERAGVGRELCRHQRHDADPLRADLHRHNRRGAGRRERLLQNQPADPGRYRTLLVDDRGRLALPGHSAAFLGRAERIGQRDALYPIQHRRDAQGLRPGQRRRARDFGRKDAHRAGHSEESADDQ